MNKKPVADRFWSKVQKTKDCWIWTAGKGQKGYGHFSLNSRHTMAHRVAYELTYGAFNKQLDVLHKCDNPSCVRPDHLFLGTHADNMRDRDIKGRHKPFYGVQNKAAKLDESQVMEIRTKFAAKTHKRKQLAKEYNVSYNQICLIVRNQHWQHV